jgi:Lrp/AsnC family leucine-responsive transcriptional regulator
MGRIGRSLDKTDLGILKILQEDCRTPIHYRIKRIEEEGIIEGYHAKIDHAKLGKDYLAATFVRAEYGPGYHESAGRKLAEIPGVWAVYFILGENDFFVLSRSSDREDYLRKLEKIMSMPEIERTSTQVIAKVIKEDLREEIDL